MKYRNQHANWKENAGYKAVHLDARKYWFGGFCEDCGASNRKLHMANLSGNYLREESDWKTLCVPCHYRLDKKSHLFIQKPGKSGWRGVIVRASGSFRAVIVIDKHKISLGDFKDIENAAMIRLAAEEQLIKETN